MIKGKRLKQTSILALFFFVWFSAVADYQIARAQEAPVDNVDKLTQGKEKYEQGDYESSIKLLEEVTQDAAAPVGKRAEAYYFLAKNYFAVSPDKVKEILVKGFETDWFFTYDEKDDYFKKLVEEARKEYLEKMPVNEYLDKAEAEFEKGKYEDARYFYRVASQKLSASAIEKKIKDCEDAQVKKQGALEQYKQAQYEAVFNRLKELNKLSPKDEEIKAAVNHIESVIINPMIEAGDKHVAEKKYKEAIASFEGVLKYIPDHKDVRQKMSMSRDMLESVNEASKKIEIEKLKTKYKKKFPVLPVLLGVAAVAVILVLVLKKKKPKVGTINVQSTPTNAAIWLDGADTGQATPWIFSNVQPGSHAVKLVKAGYIDNTTNVTVEAGKEAIVNTTLSPVPEFVTDTNLVIIREGGQNTFSVRLSGAPPSQVNVQVTKVDGGDSDISIVSGGELSFSTTSWNQPQTVTLQAASDADILDGTATIRIRAVNYDAMQYKDITAQEQDTTILGVLEVTDVSEFISTGKVGGPFTPDHIDYRLKNIGQASIHWTVSKSAIWINLNGTSGTLTPNNDTLVTVSINDNANALSANTSPYTDIIAFKNDTNDKGSTNRSVKLYVNAPQTYNLIVTKGIGVNGNPETGVFTYNATDLPDYEYSLKTGYKDLSVTLDGVVVSPIGVITMNANHTLIASAKPYPTVAITSPSNGDLVYCTKNISVNTSDVGTVTNLDIYIDNIGEISILNPPASYTYPWNTKLKDLSDGIHRITAIATNNEGFKTTAEFVDVNVKNSELIVLPEVSFTSSGPAGGTFSPSSIQYTIINPTSSSKQWSLTKTAAWLDVSAASGTLDVCGSVPITVSINSSAQALSPGVYTDTLTFTNVTSSAVVTTRSVTLTVN